MTSDFRLDLAAGLAGLAGLLVEEPVTSTLSQVAGFTAAAVPGADGVGLALVDGTDRTRLDTVAANADFVRPVDDAQYRLGEGPGLCALQTTETQVSGSLGGDRRWPRFGPRAGRLGVHSVLCLPMVAVGRTVGVLNVYGRRRDAFDEAAVRIGELFARPAAVSVANVQKLEQSRRLAEQLQQALGSRATIDQAIGIIISRTGATAAEAFERLRETSRTSGTRVAEVAEHLVAQARGRARARWTQDRE